MAVVDLVRELARVCPDRAIVSILNRLSYKKGAENTWTGSRVQHLRYTNQMPCCSRLPLSPISLEAGSRQMEMSSEGLKPAFVMA